MPKYLFWHPTIPNMPQEAVEALKAKLSQGEPDQFGVTVRNIFVGTDVTYGYAEALNPDSVQKAHETMGVKLGEGDIIEVESLL